MPPILIERRRRARKILTLLREEFPRPPMPLNHETPFQLLIATILSAQCTDERVNSVTKDLFVRYPSAAAFASLDQEALEREIRPTGFFRMKAKNVIGCSRAIMQRHGGTVPQTMEELVALPGVGRKTANVVLGHAFHRSEGIVVDTHVLRVSRRLGLTSADDPVRVEDDLMACVKRDDWIDIGLLLILHGRKTCIARKPHCPRCPLKGICPSAPFFLATVE